MESGMTQGRKNEIELKVREYSTKFLIDQIDQALDDIFGIFTLAFAEGNQIPQGSEVIRVALFKDLWEKMEIKNLEFSSLEELDIYYYQLAKLLNFYVPDFISLYDNQGQKIPEQQYAMFLQIIKLYHTLAKNRFLLSQFHDDDHPTSFAKYIQDFKEVCGIIPSDFDLPNLRQYKKIILLLDSLDEEIASRLMKMNYLKSQPITKKLNENNENEILKSVSILLSELPPIEKMNKVIDDLQKSVKLKDELSIDRHKNLLQEYVQCIQEIKRQLQKMLTRFLKEHEKILKEIVEERNTIQEKIEQLDLHHDFFRVLNLLSDIRENNQLQESFKNASNECKQQSQRWLTNGPWNVADQGLEKIFKTLDNHYKCFMETYADLLIGVNSFLEFIKMLYKRNEQLKEISLSLAGKLQNVNHLWLKSHDGITLVETALNNHIEGVKKESVPTYMTSFLSRHWWKIVLGGIGGGGSGAGISFLLTLDAVGVSFLCLSGIILGSSTGAVSGVLTDYCGPQNTDQEENEEAVSLLSEKFDDNPDQLDAYEEELKNINRLQQVLIINDSNEQLNLELSRSRSTSWWWPSFSFWSNTNNVPQQGKDQLTHKKIFV